MDHPRYYELREALIGFLNGEDREARAEATAEAGTASAAPRLEPAPPLGAAGLDATT
jgi:hypothetical protein